MYIPTLYIALVLPRHNGTLTEARKLAEPHYKVQSHESLDEQKTKSLFNANRAPGLNAISVYVQLVHTLKFYSSFQGSIPNCLPEVYYLIWHAKQS